jgi:hypothetical protein
MHASVENNMVRNDSYQQLRENSSSGNLNIMKKPPLPNVKKPIHKQLEMYNPQAHLS